MSKGIQVPLLTNAHANKLKERAAKRATKKRHKTIQEILFGKSKKKKRVASFIREVFKKAAKKLKKQIPTPLKIEKKCLSVPKKTIETTGPPGKPASQKEITLCFGELYSLLSGKA